jgi:hypothetical protein
MTDSFFERPVLNSPYEAPKLHHSLDEEGQPLDLPPAEGRRRSELITPVPKPQKHKNKASGQGRLGLGDDAGLSTEEQEYNPTPIIDDLVRRTKQEARSAERATGKETTPDLFGDFNGIAPEARTEFYQHWSNRMILGDSLYVMASLATREAAQW